MHLLPQTSCGIQSFSLNHQPILPEENVTLIEIARTKMLRSVLSNIRINMYETTKMQVRSKQDVINNKTSVNKAVATHPIQWVDTISNAPKAYINIRLKKTPVTQN